MRVGICFRCGVTMCTPLNLIRERERDDTECKTYKCPNCYVIWTFDETLRRLVRA